MANILYKFYSKSQHILVLSHQGRRYKVRFSTPYNGVARFFTGDESLAAKIRDSFQFRQGVIKEEAPSMAIASHPSGETAGHSAGKPAGKPQGAETKGKPAWLNQSMTDGPKKPSRAPLGGAEGAATESLHTEQGEAATQSLHTEQEESQQTGPTESQQTGKEGGLFEAIKIEDVQTYMDVKAYLRDALGVATEEIRTKDQVSAYCHEHGITFPNYAL